MVKKWGTMVHLLQHLITSDSHKETPISKNNERDGLSNASHMGCDDGEGQSVVGSHVLECYTSPFILMTTSDDRSHTKSILSSSFTSPMLKMSSLVEGIAEEGRVPIWIQWQYIPSMKR